MYKLVWKTQSSNAAQEEMHSTLKTAVRGFRESLKDLYVRGGGMVAILEEEHWETGAEALVMWQEHIEGGFASGTAWMDVNPLENLDKECGNEGCCWHSEDSCELCDECEREGLEMVLMYLLK